MKVFAERLKLLRKQKSLTQKKMAEFLGCTEQHYQRIEYGKINIPTLDLIALADYFGVSLDYLTGRSDDPELHMPSNEEREAGAKPKDDGDVKSA
jgi:transcriptional regulator with XRE-family HTH domain